MFISKDLKGKILVGCTLSWKDFCLQRHLFSSLLSPPPFCSMSSLTAAVFLSFLSKKIFYSPSNFGPDLACMDICGACRACDEDPLLCSQAGAMKAAKGAFIAMWKQYHQPSRIRKEGERSLPCGKKAALQYHHIPGFYPCAFTRNAPFFQCTNLPSVVYFTHSTLYYFFAHK